MDSFRVYVVVEVPIIDKKFEILVPIDKRIHDLISLLKAAIPELSQNYYKEKTPYIFNKFTGRMYDMNLIIKDSNIKTGTRLLLI